MIDYKIIQTGSDGNAVIINDFLLIDCGVSFKKIKPHAKKLKIVLLTHIHTDHFNARTIRALAKSRPTLRFACGAWLVQPLVSAGVLKDNIDIFDYNKKYLYGLCNIIPIALAHNVRNMGYKIHFPAKDGYKKMIYATDTNNLNGITAKNYDLYMIEANYDDNEIQSRIKDKKERGEYIYEYQVLKNHLSKSRADAFIYKNIGASGTYVYLHEHKEDLYEGAN